VRDVVIKIRKDYCHDCGIELIGDQRQYAQCRTCYDKIIECINDPALSGLEARLERKMRINNFLINTYAALFAFILIFIFTFICSMMTDTNALIFSGMLSVTLLVMVVFIYR